MEEKARETQRDRMSVAIQVWMVALDNYPGWKDWRRAKFTRTLHFDDLSPVIAEKLKAVDEFKFAPEIENQHAVVLQYLGLEQAIYLLKECEFYFRRYPFRGLPVTRYSHLTNVCEMYFGRFYEFKERLKKYFEAMKKVAPAHGLNIGAFIKRYEKVFADELRERNGIHHHSRFEDLALDRIFLTETISTMRKGDWEQEHIAEYRKLANEWVQRVRSRGAKLEEFLEAVAEATLASCAFLSDSSVSSGQAATNGHAEHVSAFRGLGGALTATDAE